MKKYNIHNLLTIEIEDGLEDTNRIYDFLDKIHELNSTFPINKIRVNKIISIDISDHREYFDNIFISPKSLIDYKYGIKIIVSKNEIVLNTKFRFIEWLMYSIQLALLRVDCTLIHGAAISKNDEAILFPSWGGVGKTAILNDFVKKYGFDFIGDDLFILDKKGNIFSFPKPMVLYPYHRNLFPEIFKKSPSLIPARFTKTVSSLVPKIKKILSPFPTLMNYARNHNPQVKWALPVEVFDKDKICYQTKVKSAFWLERSNEKTQLAFENKNICSQILGSTINEFDQRVVYSVNVLMGLGLLSNEKYYIKWTQVLDNGLKHAIRGSINVSNSVSINEIGSVIKELIDSEK